MFYKIVSGGVIVDACEGLDLLAYQAKNRVWLSCRDCGAATGILSSDGKSIYQLAKDGSVPIDGYPIAAVTEIDEEAYISLRDELIANSAIEDSENTSGDESDASAVGGQEPTAKGKLLLMVESLQEKVSALEEQNNILIECILEMSESIYE